MWGRRQVFSMVYGTCGMVDRGMEREGNGVFSERPSRPVTMSICRYVGMFRHIATTEQNGVQDRVNARNPQKHGENTLVSVASAVADPDGNGRLRMVEGVEG